MGEFTQLTPALLLALAGSAVAAGFAGGLFGIGGGVVLVPVLTIMLGVPIRLAVAASLATAAAISVSASAVYLYQHRIDLRLATLLELAGTVGALVGFVAGSLVAPRVIYLLFAGALVYAAVAMLRYRDMDMQSADSNNPDSGAPLTASRISAGLGGALAGGTASGMLGIGGGVIYVPVLRVLMAAPLRTAIATSALVVGLTAATGALAYYRSGELNAVVAGPCVLFAMLGAQAASRLSRRISTRWLNWAFILLLLYFAARMVLQGFQNATP